MRLCEIARPLVLLLCDQTLKPPSVNFDHAQCALPLLGSKGLEFLLNKASATLDQGLPPQQLPTRKRSHHNRYRLRANGAHPNRVHATIRME